MNKPRISAFVGVILLLSAGVAKSTPKVDIGITLSEQYSDNVGQDEVNQDDSFITEVNPGVTLSDRGAKTDYLFHYDYRFLEYTNDDYERRQEHNLNARVSRSEFDNALKLSADARVFNSEINSSESSIGGGISGNERVQTNTYGATAAYKSGMRQWHDSSLEGSVRHTDTENNLADVNYYQLQASTKEGKRLDNFYWTARGNSFQDSVDNSSDLAFGRLGVRFLQDFSVFGQTQYEENITADEYNYTTADWGVGIQLERANTRIAVAYNKVEKGDNDNFTSVDLTWNPSTRTRVVAVYTYRFFGESYFLDLSHSTRSFKNTLNYKDSVTSFAQEEGGASAFGFLVCPQGQQLNPGNCFVPPSLNQPVEPGFELVGIELQSTNISEDQILNRTLSYTTAYTHSKSTISATTYWNRSKQLNDQNFSAKDYDKELGATVSWVWRVASRTSFTLSGQYRDIQTNTGSISEILANEYSTRWSLDRNFTQKISGAVSYTYLDRNSNAVLDSYTENRIGVSAIAKF